MNHTSVVAPLEAPLAISSSDLPSVLPLKSHSQIRPRGRLHLRCRLRSPPLAIRPLPLFPYPEKWLRLALCDKLHLHHCLPKPLWQALSGGAVASGGDGGVEVCAFNNHHAGRSSVPADNSEYKTKIMAKDAIAVLDYLGWERTHVIGHSMGAMIACKLDAMVPHRVLSLGLLNVTGGGYECFPKVLHPLQYAMVLPLNRMMELDGGHLVSHERTKEVNQALLELVKVSKVKDVQQD